MKKSDIIAQVDRLTLLVGDQRAELQRLKSGLALAHANLRRESGFRHKEWTQFAANFREFTASLKEGLGGGTWTTAAGHKRFIALLSTEHLRNILLFEGASESVKAKCTSEIQRRDIDAAYRQKEVGLSIQLGLAQAERREFVKDPRKPKAPSKRKPTRRARKA